jgi:hypothetical protein
MTRYLLQVYRGAEGSAYYPEKNLRSVSRGRLARRAQKLEREGFRVRLLTIADKDSANWAMPVTSDREPRP